jgi:hypothetical protein
VCRRRHAVAEYLNATGRGGRGGVILDILDIITFENRIHILFDPHRGCCLLRVVLTKMISSSACAININTSQGKGQGGERERETATVLIKGFKREKERETEHLSFRNLLLNSRTWRIDKLFNSAHEHCPHLVKNPIKSIKKV